MAKRRFRFLKDRRGATSTEFAIIALVFFASMIAIVDFGRALYSYNRAVKACQLGVRFAVVNDMVPSNLMTWDGVVNGGLNPGQPIPASAFPTPIACIGDIGGAGGGCTPNEGYDSDAYNAIVNEMAMVYRQIATDDDAAVTVTYEVLDGWCFAGKPDNLGLDLCPMVTVELTGLTFDFITPFVNFGGFVFPECSASLTGEDFQT